MEATALSLGKAVLDGAVCYAKSVVAEEIALQLGVEGDVAFIGDELEMMQSFLMTADEEQDKHKVLLTWVKQVREVAYNVEDSLMDFVHHSGKKSCCRWCIPRTLWERHIIAKEVRELRTKVEEVSNRNLRYRLIKGSGSKPTTATEEQANVATEAMLGINEATRTAMKMENSVVDLRQLITNEDEDRSVIAVWGASGDLRTTAIRDVYDDPAARENFGFRARIKLVHPFNPREFIQSLERQYYQNFPEAIGSTHKRRNIGISVLMKVDSMSQSEMLDVFDTKVTENRYFIVVDDVSTKEEWDCIENYFPDNKKGSRVIVSTQHAEIARLCTEKECQVSELKQSSHNQSLYVFHRKVMLSSDSTNENLEMSRSEIQEEEKQPKYEDGDKVSELNSTKKFDRSKTMALFDEVLHGRTNDVSRVIELVGQPDDGQGCKVISVWGMGGLGKTTLIQSVYKSPDLGDWKRAWATVLRPFNPEQLLKKLIGDLGAETTVELKELSNKLIQILKDKKCLIIVDDVSSTAEWDLVKSCLENATRIIVTTRKKSIAKHCSNEVKNMYNLSGLEEDAALDLFKRKVFKDDFEKMILLPDMIEQARLILKKCDGLPLAISTIGGFLATKPKTATEWRKTYDRISTELEINQELRTIKTVLLRSYDGLPYHLKSCFLYLSIFPEDHNIRRKRLIRRWVAEGYAREMHGMTAEEVGDMYFEELLDRSMILPGGDVNIYSGKIDSCQLHDIMRQICISKAREENIAFTLEDGCSLSNTQGTIRHLAISSKWNIAEQDLFQRIVDLSRVRSLTVFRESPSFVIYEKMRFLRVLDLQAIGYGDRHLNQIGELIHLKLLSLRGCKYITHLPNSLGKLVNLQILDIRDTGVAELPIKITNLRKLQFLRGNHLVFSRGIAKLNALCTLARVVAHAKGKGAVKELTQLHLLRKLGVEGITETNNKEFWSAIGSLNHLRSLSVNWKIITKYELDCSLGGSLVPPRSIESLKLGTRVVRLTEWVHQLQNLTRLHLHDTDLQQDAIQAIGKLPSLANLGMRYHSFKGEKLAFEQGSFPGLLLLELNYIDDASSVMFEDETMPKLEVLRIINWEKLQGLSGLRCLTELKEVELRLVYSNKQFEDNVQEQLVGHPNNNVRVLWK